MLTPHLPCRALGGVVLLLAASGCGLAVGDAELPSATAWCDQAADFDVAEVEVRHLWEESVWKTQAVTLFDAAGRTRVKLDVGENTEQRFEYTLDAEGNVTAMVEMGPSGVVQRLTETTYDQAGRPTVTTVDDGADGLLESIQTTTYTEGGAILRKETDQGADGTVEVSETYTYAGSGLLLEIREERPSGERTTVFTYDSSDRAVRLVETVVGSDGLIERERVDELERNEAGLVTVQRTYWTVGGTDEFVERRRYDSQGRLIRTELLGPSGPPGFVVEFRYGGGTTPILTRIAGTGGTSGWDMVITRAACD